MLKCGVTRAYLEYALVNEETAYVLSFFERSFSTIKSIGASLNTDVLRLKDRRYMQGEEYSVYYAPVVYGKEKFFHAIAVKKTVNEDFFITKENTKEKDFYSFLMNNYSLPLLEEWSHVLFQTSLERGYLRTESRAVWGEYAECRNLPYVVYDVFFTENDLKEMVSNLLSKKKIVISEKQMEPLEFKNMDEYFKNYGHTLVENLQKEVKPYCELDGNINHLVLKNKRLFPQQAAQVNGVCTMLEHSKYAILNMGMGTGKTICSASMAEGYFINKFFHVHPKATLKDAYEEGTINYRNIVMCPGHLVEKWKKELLTEIPYAKVTILRDFSQLVKIKQKGKARKGKEWFIIGKDFAKLSYQKTPVPQKMVRKHLKARQCTECKNISTDFKGESFKCTCGSTHFQTIVISDSKNYGMACPYCGEVLIKNGVKKDFSEIQTLMAEDFATSNSKNQRCHICGEPLWQPFVSNINMPGTEWYNHANRKNPWYKATHYANKKHKATKTVWVHRNYESDYWESIGETPLRRIESDGGVRKVAPSHFIKTQLKGYFDFFILDEAHLFKGGATAQGNAMQALVSVSKKQLALTGTIAGGVATHLFYLLYRLDPERMRMKGYGFSDELKFAEKYGTIEREYLGTERETEEINNACSKGKQISSPKIKPGISPLIFSDFLLDKTVFLDLSDMSRFLPQFKENVVITEAETEEETEVLFSYQNTLKQLKEASRGIEGRAALSEMLQFGLSFPDHPYGRGPVISAYTGEVIVRPDDFSELIAGNSLLAKEKKLVELIKEELAENRNSVIYCEYTGKAETCVTHRLKDILQRELYLRDNEVVIIESSSPEAGKREAWMHKKASEGAKVFIVNPKCVETGLDFCWEEDGKIYNYPTLIFYQMGYSLFTIWQASRRSYRLNQKEECRVAYMAYAGTMQQAVIQLIAEKQAATSAIQGKFSVEGLAAMANGIDEKVRLAQAMSSLDSYNGNELQEMFDVLNRDDTDVSLFSNYEPMQTFYELMGREANVVEETLPVSGNNGDSVFQDFLTIFSAESERLKDVEELDESISAVSLKQTKKHIQLAQAGQMSLF